MTSPADWALRFQALAAEAGRASARVLGRYDELLGRVARGELRAEAVQAQVRDYLQDRAAVSTRELVEASVGLLAGLLYAEAKHREALLAGLLPPDAPIPPPPAPGSVDLANWFQTLATYAAEQSARGVARHQQLMERVASGEVTAARVQEHGRRFLEQHAPRLLDEVMELGLTFVGGLQHASASLSEGLYDRVLGPDETRAGQPEAPLCVDLRAPAGSVAAATIVVENGRPAPADVVCQVSPFTPRAGGAPFRARLDVVPARFALAPGAHRDVDLRLLLDPALFAAGADHLAMLRISGAGDGDRIVQLLARADPPAAPPARAARPRARRPRAR